MHTGARTRVSLDSRFSQSAFSVFDTDASSVALVAASWDRCQSKYGLDPQSRLIGNRYSDSEFKIRREPLEEPLARAKPLIEQIRRVARNADYCMLIADGEGAAVAEYCDSPLARQIKSRGIAIGTVWDEPCAGTNGIGTALASNHAITVNGDQHYHRCFRQFICAAAPIVDHRGLPIGVLNLTSNATSDQAEAMRVNRYIRRCAHKLHTFQFRDFFRHCTLVAVTDSPFDEDDEMSRLLAVDDSGRVLGATNELLMRFESADRSELLGKRIGEIIGVEFDTLLANEGRLHRFDSSEPGGSFALSMPPCNEKPAFSDGRRHRRSRRANTQNISPLDALAGGDRKMQKIVSICRRVMSRRHAMTDLPILLQGETGTGKDTFAQALHRESERRDKPFVGLNCAALPESLIDSELFGYAPGTFTGGLKEGKAGQVIAANGGTLFLDEIGDMPLESQIRLLRVLAERQVQPLGVTRCVDVDFRLICATHRNLIELVREGRFREDLYYRICGAKLTLTPLRLRQDFDDLVRRLLEELEPEQRVSLSETVWNHLRACLWPGNIRQLRNVLQYVVLSCGEGVASVEDLPEDTEDNYIASLSRQSEIDRSCSIALSARTKTLQAYPAQGSPAWSDSRREELTATLYRTRWSVSQAARELGVSRATVHRRMKKFNISRPGR